MLVLTFKILRTDKIKAYVLLLSVLIFAINVICLIINFIENKIENQIINKLGNRIMYIASNDTDDYYELIKSIPGVQDVYYNIDPFVIKFNNADNYYFKYINPLIRLNLLSGSVSNLGYNEIIIPEEVFKYYQKSYTDVINSKISITKGNQSIELTIVGIYLNDNEQEQYIYISNNNDLNDFIENKNRYIVLIDNQANYEMVEKLLKNNGCYVELIDDSSKSEMCTYQEISKILNNFSMFCYIILIFVLVFLLFSNVIEKKYSIALLKTFGYSNTVILIIILITFMFILLISFSIAIFIIKCIDILLLYYFKIKHFLNIDIIIKNFCIILISLVTAVYFTFIKISKLNIIKLLRI